MSEMKQPCLVFLLLLFCVFATPRFRATFDESDLDGGLVFFVLREQVLTCFLHEMIDAEVAPVGWMFGSMKGGQKHARPPLDILQSYHGEVIPVFKRAASESDGGKREFSHFGLVQGVICLYPVIRS